MKLNDIKVGNLYVLRADDDAVLYKAVSIDGFIVSIIELGTTNSEQFIDYSLLKNPTKKQTKKAQ